MTEQEGTEPSAEDRPVDDVPPLVEIPASERSFLKRRVVMIGGLAVGILAVGAIAWGIAASMQPSPLENAAEACGGSKPLDNLMAEIKDADELDGGGELAALFDGVVSVEDDGKTLIIQTSSQDDDPLGVTSLALDCVYEELDVPTRITASIGQTRALDGRQADSWSDYSVQWSYHPDSGASVIIARD